LRSVRRVSTLISCTRSTSNRRHAPISLPRRTTAARLRRVLGAAPTAGPRSHPHRNNGPAGGWAANCFQRRPGGGGGVGLAGRQVWSLRASGAQPAAGRSAERAGIAAAANELKRVLW